ncbi:MAG: endopeptidase La [Eubacterium sp.]|nr:endopeptidase La [Eubacterium sp.]
MENRVLPLIPLRGMCILPGMVAHFDISRETSIKAIEESMMGSEEVFLVTQRNINDEEVTAGGLYTVGVIAKIKQVVKMQHNLVRVLVEGRQRARLCFFESGKHFYSAEAEILGDYERFDSIEEQALDAAMINALETYAHSSGKDVNEFMKPYRILKIPGKLLLAAAGNLSLVYEKKQEILEQQNLKDAIELLCKLIYDEIEIITIRKEFEEKVRSAVDKNQKDYLLREQMKVIREELGEDTTVSDIDTFKEQTENLEAEDWVKEKIYKEIDRLKMLGGGSSESAVTRGYIETLLELPWDKMSEDNNDLKNAAKILDRDHYGLEKVKERILEFLAVRSLTEKGETPIICLVGPPGTGKTSIARSVAEALEKKYIRIHLGGVRDEAEIRGHRRTYVGAMPGRIAVGLKNAGVKNPLMLLDEIDKVSNDYKGDTFSALLEVLDPDQNKAFSDHYVEIPIDLSEVLFIATANTTQTIPQPLLDRMEVIEVTSYTENEKAHIAKDHLIDKQIKKNGLKKGQLSIGKKPLEIIIRNYTREAGVRNLERRIGDICRKAAREILEGETDKVKVTAENIEHYLGKKKYSFDKKNSHDEIGIVRGLAWTAVGGDTLEIEVNVMPGKGDFVLTGKLGDVMKESAQAGISFIRSVSDKYKIDKEFFKEHDIHIHIPEGAVPKDGPSAGITMATAMLSAITKVPVRADIAMTGEITLRGRVLPIGGLKEKTLAAKNAGIKTVLVPKKNKPDIEELSDEITEGLEIIYVEKMEEVLKEALVR